MKNVITWFDLPTLDFERAMEFYSNILGAEMKSAQENGQMMSLFPTEGTEGVGGCLLPPDKHFKPGNKGARIYLNVGENLDQILGMVEGAGGKILKKKYPIGEYGFTATIEDSEGNVVGLHGKK